MGVINNKARNDLWIVPEWAASDLTTFILGIIP